MTREEIIAKVNGILTEEFEMAPDGLRPEAKLADDLELDSLDGVDLVVSLEKAFGCRIKEEDARQMRELGQIYDYIEKACTKGS